MAVFRTILNFEALAIRPMQHVASPIWITVQRPKRNPISWIPEVLAIIQCKGLPPEKTSHEVQ